jgi:hypothetical protein
LVPRFADLARAAEGGSVVVSAAVFAFYLAYAVELPKWCLALRHMWSFGVLLAVWLVHAVWSSIALHPKFHHKALTWVFGQPTLRFGPVAHSVPLGWRYAGTMRSLNRNSAAALALVGLIFLVVGFLATETDDRRLFARSVSLLTAAFFV